MEDTTLIRLMIVHYQAVLNTALNPGARKIVLQLLTDAELELSKARRTREDDGSTASAHEARDRSAAAPKAVS